MKRYGRSLSSRSGRDFFWSACVFLFFLRLVTLLQFAEVYYYEIPCVCNSTDLFTYPAARPKRREERSTADISHMLLLLEFIIMLCSS
ncbi:hypothetical protein QBC46DRAFT_373020 [Diplogelasinospora grovesii]|uniref:Uncharacterized protein n=1 Tax=Diplogelasinospora grovesii TaxID=303347 RepID=A0AAN6S9N6_9PEZI|nr:hypothetical protein QBC46DRAFT_373020 [Diplogelasinospora grovesii]